MATMAAAQMDASAYRFHGASSPGSLRDGGCSGGQGVRVGRVGCPGPRRCASHRSHLSPVCRSHAHLQVGPGPRPGKPRPGASATSRQGPPRRTMKQFARVEIRPRRPASGRPRWRTGSPWRPGDLPITPSLRIGSMALLTSERTHGQLLPFGAFRPGPRPVASGAKRRAKNRLVPGAGRS